VMLARADGERLSVHQIADKLSISADHLSKVMQRLAKAGLVDSIRGPGGGFALTKASGKVRLLDIYEAIEGKFEHAGCILPKGVCMGKKCILGGLLGTVNEEVYKYLSETTLKDCV